MLTNHKNYFLLILFVVLSETAFTEEDPYIFIDNNAQLMVETLKNNKQLFSEDRDLFEDKIKEIFEPMIDFRRISASVMGKKYYMQASKVERIQFVTIFKDSLLDTYAETLAQWEDQAIETVFLDYIASPELKKIEVKQELNTGDSIYPILYKLRKTNDSWAITNIIINGVNLGLTFRNQFRALADEHKGDVSLTIDNWVSDAGNAGIDE
ncbi:ABC transporter substrate-binding protein [Gammaproteobacteria bacterium]|nr:ABC transporter substrate-binding protein [Gammaproteobacteria bacterium]